MKKIKTIITVLTVSLFLSGIQSCYVEQDTGRHRWWYHRHDRDRDRDHHDRERGRVIILDPDHHDRVEHDHWISKIKYFPFLPTLIIEWKAKMVMKEPEYDNLSIPRLNERTKHIKDLLYLLDNLPVWLNYNLCWTPFSSKFVKYYTVDSVWTKYNFPKKNRDKCAQNQCSTDKSVCAIYNWFFAIPNKVQC